MAFDPEETRRRIEFNRLLRASSLGNSAWVNCPRHGRTAKDPYEDVCVWCNAEWLQGLAGEGP